MNTKQSIASSALQVSALLFFIKLLGVVKQSLIAAKCGANAETDAYFVATGVMVALGSIIFSSISVSLLSLHTERLMSKGRESSNNLINVVLHTFVPISILIAILFAVGAPLIAKFLAPAYQGEQLQLLSRNIRILSVMFVFTCYYLIINVVLETDKRFLPGKGQSLLQNLFICIAAVLFYPTFGMSALIGAFLLAGIVQCIQITWNARREFHFVYKVKPERDTIRKLLSLSLPLLIGNAIYEINDIVDKQIATGLGDGNVSYLSYGASINEMVTTLIIASVSTVLFSHYATWAAQKEHHKIEAYLKNSMECLAAIVMPIMAMCVVCGDCIVDILYGRGTFDEIAVKSTAGVVVGYAIGFIFQAFRSNLVRVYYAFQDTKTPMINGAISVAINILLSLTLSRFLGIAGVALSTSIAMFTVTLLLLPGISKFIPHFSFKSCLPEFVKIVVAMAVAWIASDLIRNIVTLNSFFIFIVVGCALVLIYVGLLLLLRVKCAQKYLEIVLEKLVRTTKQQ